MKTKYAAFIVLLQVVLSLLLLAEPAGANPGVIIYMEPPVAPLKMARSMSYSSYQRVSVEYGNLSLPNGTTIEIHNPGILGIFPLPPPVIDRNSPASLAALEEKAREIIGQYPYVRNPIEGVLSKWRLAIQEAAKRIPAAPRQSTQPSPVANLVVNGVSYSKATLEAVDGDFARIFHSDGVAVVPIAALSKTQIAFLNSTTSSAHIDSDWAERKKLAEEAKARRAEQEARMALEIAAAKRKDLLTKAHQFEEAARYDEALSIYSEARSDEDVKRLASTMAKDFESRKDYQSAADFFEKAGLFSEAGRVRKSYNMSESVSLVRLSSEEIFRKCAPATVSVVTEERDGVAIGSGFFVRKGGYIMTNHHVIAEARSISVIVDGKVYEATVVAQSKVPDLAVIKISLGEHAILDLEDSDRVKPGAQVFAIGTPKGLPKSITGGMVSATNRKKFGNEVFQISVLINHGNSGGPLIGENGKVIGVTTFGEGTAGEVDGVSIGSDIQGINYAIKVNEAKFLLGKIPK